jgi:hypothetical protein
MRRAAAALVLVTAAASVAEAQSAVGLPPWAVAWNPLTAPADIGRTVPLAPRPPNLALDPVRRIGLWWSAGAPAGLADEVAPGRTTFVAGGGETDGEYRRPLDPTSATPLGATALAWQPIGSVGGAAGRLGFDYATTGSLPYVAVEGPHASDPFVVTDSTRPRARGVNADLEGAIGFRFGAWRAGITGGVGEREGRTLDATFLRSERNASEGVRAGLGRTLPWLSLRVAIWGGWVGGGETVTLRPYTVDGQAFLLAGYYEPDAIQVTNTQPYFRRTDRSAWAGGAGLAGRAMGADWVFWGERSTRGDRHFSARIESPPTDTWDADGWTWGLAAQRPLAGGRMLLTGSLARTSVKGEAHRADLEGTIFRSHESLLTADVELRYAPPTSPWIVTASYHLTRAHYDRYDYIAEGGPNLVEWAPGGSVGLGRAFGGTTVSVGAAMTAYSPVGSIPAADSLGPVYQRTQAQEWTLAATRAVPFAGVVSLAQRFGARTSVVLTGRWDHLTSVGTAPDLPFAPSGDRTSWSAAAGVILAR